MALSMSVRSLTPTGNTHQNFNLQADLFDLLASDPSNHTTSASTADGQSPSFRTMQLSAYSGYQNGTYNSIVLPPTTLTPVKTSNFALYQTPPALSKPRHFSHSLPNSVNSSPRFGPSSLLKKKWRHHESQTSPRDGDDATPTFVTTRSNIGRAEKDLRRSKSCGEGRASSPASIDFDAVSERLENYGMENYDKSIIRRSSSPRPQVSEEIGEKAKDDQFKCGALCLFLPGFGKAKPVRPKGKADEYQSSPTEHITQNNIVISRSVSLEKFECGSWASSTIITDSNHNNNKDDVGDEHSSTNLYFDLPLELIRSSGNDANSPVTAAFIFNNKELRGVLKASSSSRGGASSDRKSHESSRHVRFSTTTSPRSNPDSPSACITPRLRKAREDFNAFLEAQTA